LKQRYYSLYLYFLYIYKFKLYFMNINQLKYILTVSKHRSFSKASIELGVTQPALSLQISKLEQELGVTIFNRTKKPLAITKEGDLLLKKSVHILKLFDGLYDLALELEEEISGKLNIGIIPTLAPYITPVFLEDLNHLYPKLQLIISELITEEIIDKIKSGELDTGLIATPIQAVGVEFNALFYEKFFLFVSNKSSFFKSESIKINELDLDDLWYLNEGNCFQNQVNVLCKTSSKVLEKQQIKYFSNSIESLRYIVEQRGGMTFIPELATLTIPVDKEDMIKPLEGLQPVREISLVTSKFVAKQKLIDAFTDTLLHNIPKRMKTIQPNMILDTQIIT
ncbi:MAG TPA: LysR substrate-binding domain-containing protein, partial [Bacteroidales bacterium]|nr:LysR substrate-binding domain-containing protein [Bacteroidales bacterium]